MKIYVSIKFMGPKYNKLAMLCIPFPFISTLLCRIHMWQVLFVLSIKVCEKIGERTAELSTPLSYATASQLQQLDEKEDVKKRGEAITSSTSTNATSTSSQIWVGHAWAFCVVCSC